MQKYRIGILTSGGDCPGLNAVIRAVVASADNLGWEVLGFSDGFEGLISPVRYRMLDRANTSGIMQMGGTILGTTNHGRFAGKVGYGEPNRIPPDSIIEAKETIDGLNIQALICIGGDGSLTTAQQLMDAGIPVVGVPKTIDNDIFATDTTFGFDSAIQCVTDALDRLHITASSHRRVMVIEVMGRYAGWIALHGGMAGGAQVILIPEIPFSYEKVAQFISSHLSEGQRSTMVVVAEGAHPVGEGMITQDSSTDGEHRLGGMGHRVAHEIASRTRRDTREVVLGHLQRGGNPTTIDRILATRFGVGAVKLIQEKKFGQMVSYLNYQIGSVSIAEAIGTAKTVPPDGQFVEAARAVGIYFGD
jgi:ATP-dependent phosphofructokinase / diphosphate-dependent phosphofructokinase